MTPLHSNSVTPEQERIGSYVFSPITKTFELVFSYHRFWLFVSLVSHLPWMYFLGLCFWCMTSKWSPGGGLMWILPIISWSIALTPIVIGGLAAGHSEKQTVRWLAFGSIYFAMFATVLGYASFEYSAYVQKTLRPVTFPEEVEVTE